MYDVNTLSPIKKHWLLRTSNIPPRFIGLEPSDIIEKVGSFPDEIKNWLDDVSSGQVVQSIGNIGINGVGLVFDGGPGLGKTTHAVVAAMEVVRNLPDEEVKAASLMHVKQTEYGLGFRPIYYMTYPEFLARKKSTFDMDGEDKREMMYELDGFHGRCRFDWLNVRVLILDDLGKEYGSKYDDTSFDEILRLRYDKGLPTIVTTNVRLENWEAQYSEAMASFANEAFIRVPILGSDLRGAQ